MAQAREVSDRYTELINAHDAHGIAALFADDGVLVDPGGEQRGREAIAQYWEGFFQAFPDMRGQDDFEAENGDTAINEWSASGTHTGPLEGPDGAIPATGKSCDPPRLRRDHRCRTGSSRASASTSIS